MIGFDTSFFMLVFDDHPKSLKIWQDVCDGKPAAVSCITLFELKRLFLRNAIRNKKFEQFLSGLQHTLTISWIDHQSVPENAAHYSLRFGLHATDALIIAGLRQVGVNRFYTADSDFAKVSLPKLGIQILK